MSIEVELHWDGPLCPWTCESPDDLKRAVNRLLQANLTFEECEKAVHKGACGYLFTNSFGGYVDTLERLFHWFNMWDEIEAKDGYPVSLAIAQFDRKQFAIGLKGIALRGSRRPIPGLAGVERILSYTFKQLYGSKKTLCSADSNPVEQTEHETIPDWFIEECVQFGKLAERLQEEGLNPQVNVFH